MTPPLHSVNTDNLPKTTGRCPRCRSQLVERPEFGLESCWDSCGFKRRMSHRRRLDALEAKLDYLIRLHDAENDE